MNVPQQEVRKLMWVVFWLQGIGVMMSVLVLCARVAKKRKEILSRPEAACIKGRVWAVNMVQPTPRRIV
eukprot:1153576-Pelagomonas_calceolata.AAC.2